MLHRSFSLKRFFACIIPLSLLALFVPFASPAQATFSSLTAISNGQGFLQGEFAEVGVRANGAFGSTSVPTGFHQNAGNCLGFRVDREMDGWGNTASTDDGDFFCPGSPFEGWQLKVGSIAKNDHVQTGVSGSVSSAQSSGSSQCVSWVSASPYNGVSVEQRYCVPTAGQALHTDVTLTNTTGSEISDVYFGRGFDPDNFTGTGTVPDCGGAPANTSMFQSCNAVTGQGTEAQATARWGNGAFIALQSFDARARVARQAGGFSSPDPSEIWTAGDTSASSGTYYGNIGEFQADAGLYVALKVATLGAGASTSFRISYVLSAEGNNAPVVGAPVVSGIGQTNAHVVTTINPKGYSTTATLIYSVNSDFSSSSSVSMGTFTGSDELTAEADMTGLDPSETYYAKVVATNETGTTESASFTFDTLAATAPIVSSEEPTVSVDDGPVTLSGTLNPNGFSSTATFQYSTTSDFSGTVVDVPISGTFTGTSISTVSTVVSGLTGSTTYYFRLKVTNASGSAYGSTISFVPNDIPAPTSLVVSSLDDTTASGTLRWAITQANATSGGIYDAITFTVDGIITLTSALPQITQSLTVTGNGRTQTVIDGNNLYRPFNVASGRTLTISNMTLKQGQATNGGLIFNGSGTIVATNIRFTGMTGGSAVFNNNNGSTATYTNCTFDSLNIGIAGDYGSTPQLAAGVTTWANEADSVFTNKTYVVDSVFSNNTHGINNYRFTKVQNSQFTNNSYGANVTGLNRTQILNSTFTSNGIGIYHNSWIPTTFNMGTDNRLITGNTFTNNSISMYLDDGYNNGQKNQSWVTITSNSWDAVGVWVRYYQWNGTSNAQGTARPYTTGTVFAQSSNTFPDSAGDPTNLTVTQSGSNIVLDWDAPVVSGYPVERYAIFFTTGNLGGWGVATGNVGDANALNTEYTFSESFFDGFGVESGSTWRFKIRSDNDTYGKYSAFTSEASIAIGTPPSTTTTSTTTTTVPVGDTGSGEDGGDTADTTTPPTTPTVIVEPTIPVTPPEETLPETEETATTIPEEWGSTETTLPPIEVEPTEPETVEVDNPSDNSIDLPDELTELPDNASAEDIAEVIADVDFTDISDKDFAETVDVIFDDLTDAEDVAEVLGSFLDADISDEQFEAVLDKVFEDISDTEQVTEVLTSLLSEELDKEQLVSVMETVFSEDASVEQMGAVVDDLLETDLSGEELAAVFDAVFDEDLSDEETIELAQEVLKGELDAEEFGTVIDAIFDEVVTDEVLIETFTAVLETELDAEKFSTVVDVLESDVISEEQVAEVVTLIIEQEGGVDAEQATELATSPKVLESIDGSQATEVFDAVVVAEVSQEEGSAIAEALAGAPTDVKEAFEEEINVFAGVFDTYVALGSEINVGDRRTVIAVGAAVAVAGAITAAGGMSPSSGGGAPSGGSGSPSDQNVATRKEEEQEPNGELAWDGVEWIKQLSIFRYNNGVKILDWGLFMKKFVYGLFNLGFTISGSLVVYLTLSGNIQTIAGISSVLALVAAMYLHMREPDNN